MKVIAIVLVIFSEALAIYAELAAAQSSKLSGQLEFSTALPNIVLITFAGVGLIAGYMIGVLAFGNVWTIAVVSIVAILIIEPPLVYFLFQTTPGRGELIGFAFGVLGILSTLLIKD